MVAEITRKQYAPFCLTMVILVLEYSLNRSWGIWHKPWYMLVLLDSVFNQGPAPFSSRCIEFCETKHGIQE
jgi:hypothetical protein